MPSASSFVVAFLTLASVVRASPVEKRAAVAFIDPRTNGGRMLDASAGLGEPLNVIVSGLSSPDVLSLDGFISYSKAIGFTTDCFGITLGGPETANLGDGQGELPQLGLVRADEGQPDNGSCIESIVGGNHYRFWNQTTSGAIFLASSVEEPAADGHNIVPNGYDLGRDGVVANATGGTRSFGGISYTTTVEYVSGLLDPGSNGINHNISIDGRVAVLTVTTSGSMRQIALHSALPSLFAFVAVSLYHML